MCAVTFTSPNVFALRLSTARSLLHTAAKSNEHPALSNSFSDKSVLVPAASPLFPSFDDAKPDSKHFGRQIYRTDRQP